MLRELWKRLISRRPKSKVIYLSGEHIPARRGSSAEIEGVEPPFSGLEDVSSDRLMSICDSYWDSLGKDAHFEDAFSPGALVGYNEYVSAINELGKRGMEIWSWAVARIHHSEYDAREQAAWLIGELGARGELKEQLDQAIGELSWLATRQWGDETKEVQANTAAVMALAKIADYRAVPALREILTSSYWADDDLSWDAADALGQIVGENFMEQESPEAAARDWLDSHPDASGRD